MDSNNAYQGVQALRFLAAFMVVVTHATFYFSSRVDASFSIWPHGAQGVSIFFVISGFVMMLTSRSLIERRDGYLRFIVSRVIRIVPTYWLVNVVKLAVWFALPTAVFASPDYIHIALSYFFIPARSLNGAIEPFYGVGWTLNFEMFFYVLFALTIYLRWRLIESVGVVLISLSFLSIYKEPGWPAFGFLANSIVINFLYGMIIAEVVHLKVLVPKVASLGSLILGFVVIFFLPELPLLGLQYAMFVAGVVFLENNIKGKIPRLILFGGDASYSLYLIHPMVGPAIASVMLHLHVRNPYITICAIVISSLIAGSVLYFLFEKPVGRYLKKLYSTGSHPRSSFQERSLEKGAD